MTINMHRLVEEVTTSGSAAKSAVDNSIYKYERLGFELSEKPAGKPPKLPTDGISSLEDDDVADLHSTFVRWMEYAGEQAAFQNTVSKELSVRIEDTILKLKLEYDGTVAEREAKAKTHPTVKKLRKKLLDTKATYELLSNKFDTFNYARGVCSRDVERRRKEFVANINEDSIRSMRSRKTKVMSKGPMRQRDLEVSRGRK